MKRADILNNLQHNNILSPPKAPPETFKHSSDLNEESEWECGVIAVLHDTLGGANKLVMITAIFPSSWMQVTLEV